MAALARRRRAVPSSEETSLSVAAIQRSAAATGTSRSWDALGYRPHRAPERPGVDLLIKQCCAEAARRERDERNRRLGAPVGLSQALGATVGTGYMERAMANQCRPCATPSH